MRNKLLQEILEQSPEHSRIYVRMYTDIIDRIHDLMAEKGYKQKDLAKLLGKNESEVSKWLNGGHNLTLRTLAKLEAAFDKAIIVVPQKQEANQFIGWKKTVIPTMHVHINRRTSDSDYLPSVYNDLVLNEESTVYAV